MTNIVTEQPIDDSEVLTSLPQYEEYVGYLEDEYGTTKPEVIESAFVMSALQGRVEGISKSHSIRLGLSYLNGLNSEESEDWMERDIVKGKVEWLGHQLVDTLSRLRVKSSTAGLYVEALEALYVSKTSTYINKSKITGALARKHQTVKRHADAQTAERYSTLMANPGFYGKLGDFFVHYETDDRDRTTDMYIDYDNYEANREFLQDILLGVGINDVDNCIDAWRHTTSFNVTEKRVTIETQNNLMSIAELEKQRPDAAKLLHEFYGICGFNRYGSYLLAKQYDNHGKTDKPYGIAYTSYSDHNNANSSTRDTAPVMATLEDEYDFRFIESGDALELGKRLLALDRLYGDEHKISFVLVRVHGSKERIAINNMLDKLGEVSMSTRMGKRTARIFVPDVLIVFESCSAGVEQGIAQKMSKDLSATVVAPPETVAVNRIIVANDSEELKLEPDYSTGGNPITGDKIEPVDPVLYINGQKITGKAYEDYFAELFNAREESYF
jgi:hypothetical protein